jgi:hypothetical protein
MLSGHVVERWNPMAAQGRVTHRPKPSAAGLGVDLASLEWHRSGTGAGSFEVAFVAGQMRNQRTAAGKAPGTTPGSEVGSNCQLIDWVLLRLAGDPVGRVLVYDRNEWLCFLDGAVRGEFDCRQH